MTRASFKDKIGAAVPIYLRSKEEQNAYARETYAKRQAKKGVPLQKTKKKQNDRIKKPHLRKQAMAPMDDVAAIARMAADLDFAKHVKRFKKWKR